MEYQHWFQKHIQREINSWKPNPVKLSPSTKYKIIPNPDPKTDTEGADSSLPNSSVNDVHPYYTLSSSPMLDFDESEGQLYAKG